MGDGPSSVDETLLARLNALKSSGISFDSPFSFPTTNTPPPSTDLHARFLGLGPSSRIITPHSVALPELVSENNDGSASPSPTLEELLAELESDEGYFVAKSELAEAEALIEEARTVLPKPSEGEGAAIDEGLQRRTNNIPQEIDTIGGKLTPTGDQVGSGEGSNPHDKKLDENDEAAIALQRILDELDLTSPPQNPLVRSSPPPNDMSSSYLHSAPTSLPSFPSLPQTLPSAPKSHPLSPAPKKSTKTAGYTDAEIDSWCAICLADAVVLCRGCAGELYCWTCWREGHTGPEVGKEEQAHAWEKVTDLKKGL